MFILLKLEILEILIIICMVYDLLGMYLLY